MRRRAYTFLFGSGHALGRGGCVGALLIAAVMFTVAVIATLPITGCFAAMLVEYPHGSGECGMAVLPFVMCSMVLIIPFFALAWVCTRPLGRTAAAAYLRTAQIAENRVRDYEQRQAEAAWRAGLLSAARAPADDDPSTLLRTPGDDEQDSAGLLRGAEPPCA